MRLVQLPFTVLEQIALEVAVVDPLGPPSDLISLLCTCRHLCDWFSFDKDRHLYARIFRQMFDTRAVVRRFGDRCTRTNSAAQQLKVYCPLLKRIRRGDTSAPSDEIRNDFWIALLMLLEDDGRNAAQLEWAGLGAFVDRFVRTRLRENNEMTGGWPPESEVNALALWLMWFTTDEVTLREETADARRELMELVRPYVVLPVRYPAFWQPDYHFTFPIPDDRIVYRFITPHGYYPTYRNPEHLGRVHHHLGVRFRASVPPISIAAKLLYFARSEATPFHIPTTLPATREQALEQGFTDIRPTQEDYLRFNRHKAAAPIEPASWDWHDSLNDEEARLEDEGVWRKSLRSNSSKWDLDWYRMLYCFDPWYVSDIRPMPYIKGAFEGDWEGRMLLPNFSQYYEVASSSFFSPQKPDMTTVPISLRVREYHCVSPRTPAPPGGLPKDQYVNLFNDGIIRAWLPDGWELREGYGRLRPHDQHGIPMRDCEYVRWQDGARSGHDSTTCAMCIEREEEERRAELANRKKRKSPSDMDEADDDDDAVDQARPKRARARSPSTRRQEPIVVQPGAPADMPNLVITGDEAEHRAELQALPFEPSAMVEELLDAEMRDPGASGPCDGVQDIMIVGETLPKHGQAWHHYRFFGRVRRYDGLVAIVRTPTFVPDLGTTIFRGYIVGNQHFVGSWRGLHDRSTPLEGPFIMSRSSAQ